MLPVVQHCYSVLRLYETTNHEMSRTKVSCSQNFADRFLKCTAAVDITQLGQYQKFTSAHERVYSIDKLQQ
jgi:hypothetical protein